MVRSASEVFLIDLGTHADVWSHSESGEIALAQGALYIARSDGWLTCIEFAAVPNPVSISPARAHCAESPIRATIHGAAFLQGTGISVRFGTDPATNVNVIDDNTIECTIPARGPGLVDVIVEHSLGRGILEDGFAYTPALKLGEDPPIGGLAEATFLCDPGDSLAGFYGPPPLVRIPTPP